MRFLNNPLCAQSRRRVPKCKKAPIYRHDVGCFLQTKSRRYDPDRLKQLMVSDDASFISQRYNMKYNCNFHMIFTLFGVSLRSRTFCITTRLSSESATYRTGNGTSGHYEHVHLGPRFGELFSLACDLVPMSINGTLQCILDSPVL
jgi:hypothetical protein